MVCENYKKINLNHVNNIDSQNLGQFKMILKKYEGLHYEIMDKKQRDRIIVILIMSYYARQIFDEIKGYEFRKSPLKDYDISVLSDTSMTKEKLITVVEKFYTKEKQQYGVLGIRIELI